MALFGSKTKKSAAGAPFLGGKKEAASAGVGHISSRSLANVLLHARITEKATDLAGASVYTFDVAPSATKRDIRQAVQALYSVSPRAIRIVTVPRKSVYNRRSGRIGFKSGGKKAYVYLKKGETITIT
ncbi:MAG TPA: 50S ribosomal protein L23 [Candidatus Paceibacterota bacterium]